MDTDRTRVTESRDIIRTDKVAASPSLPGRAIIHGTLRANILTNDKLKAYLHSRNFGTFKNVFKEDIGVGFMGVWSVARSLEGIMSDWLDLSEHQHPNCYLGFSQMIGGEHLRIVVEIVVAVSLGAVDFSFKRTFPLHIFT